MPLQFAFLYHGQEVFICLVRVGLVRGSLGLGLVLWHIGPWVHRCVAHEDDGTYIILASVLSLTKRGTPRSRGFQRFTVLRNQRC